MVDMPDVTTILKSLQNGEQKDSAELFSLVYEELRKMAAGKMAAERPDHTLQATALVNEAFLRLVGNQDTWNNRHHFFGAASEAMRRILIENARRRKASKRGSGASHTPLDESVHTVPSADDKLLQVHEVLDSLEAHDALKAQVVKLHVFVGLTHREIASLLELSERTTRRHWELAKIWMFDQITDTCDMEDF